MDTSFHTNLLIMAKVWFGITYLQDEPMPRRLLQMNLKSSLYALLDYTHLDFNIHHIPPSLWQTNKLALGKPSMKKS